jgi:hypothetical protein
MRAREVRNTFPVNTSQMPRFLTPGFTDLPICGASAGMLKQLLNRPRAARWLWASRGSDTGSTRIIFLWGIYARTLDRDKVRPGESPSQHMGATWTHDGLTPVVSGVPGHRDALSPSPASLAAPFLPVGNWPFFLLTTCLPMC